MGQHGTPQPITQSVLSPGVQLSHPNRRLSKKTLLHSVSNSTTAIGAAKIHNRECLILLLGTMLHLSQRIIFCLLSFLEGSMPPKQFLNLIEMNQVHMFINPRRTCTARVTVVGYVCVCVSVTPHLTSRVFVRLTKDTTYLTGNEGQTFGTVFSKTFRCKARALPRLQASAQSAILSLRKMHMRLLTSTGSACSDLICVP